MEVHSIVQRTSEVLSRSYCLPSVPRTMVSRKLTKSIVPIFLLGGVVVLFLLDAGSYDRMLGSSTGQFADEEFPVPSHVCPPDFIGWNCSINILDAQVYLPEDLRQPSGLLWTGEGCLPQRFLAEGKQVTAARRQQLREDLDRSPVPFEGRMLHSE